MQLDFLTVFTNIGILLALAIPGYVLRRRNMITSSVVPGLVTLLLFVNQPFLTIKGFLMKTYDSSILINMGFALLFSFLAHFLWLFLARLFIKEKGADNIAKRVDQFSVVFCNATFIGIPIVMSLFASKPEAIIYVSIFAIPFNILLWTLGAYMLTHDKKYINLKKAFFNPPTLALFVCLPLFFFQVPVDPSGLILKGISYLGDMTAPVSMIILGIRYAELKPLSIFQGFGLYRVSCLRLLIAPVLFFLIMLPFTKDPILLSTMFLIGCLPVAGSTVLFAERLQSDVPTAVKNNLSTSVFSFLTLPLMSTLLVLLFSLFHITF